MITTNTELKVFKDLVIELKKTIEAIGICDHEVNVCLCWEIALYTRALEILKKHEERNATF